MDTSAIITTSSLPTPIAKVVQRLNDAGENASADTFLMTSLITEFLIKIIAVGLLTGMRKRDSSVAHRLEYELVRANGLGEWQNAIQNLTVQSQAGYIHSEMRPLINWLSKKRNKPEDAWAKEVNEKCNAIFRIIGVADIKLPANRLTARHLISDFVRIRNKTKGHGALGPDFFERANPLYISATKTILDNCPVTNWEWYHLSVRQKKNNVRAIKLQGESVSHVTEKQSETLRPKQDGLHFRTIPNGSVFRCSKLIDCNRECTSFKIANGSYNKSGAEYLDYGDGKSIRSLIPEYEQPPAPLPASTTQGKADLDIYNNVYGNLPEDPPRYVDRRRLQEKLITRLRDRNHPVITLHGRGGIGKTSLALHVTHELSKQETPPFDHILWLSARDLDLKPSGPKEVRREVANLDDVCKNIDRLLGCGENNDDFAMLLQDPELAKSKGILFVFDNFETFDNPKSLHRFLDTHTHIPNKILITSRERTFKGDFPVEVGGMAFEEAHRLMLTSATELSLDPAMIENSAQDIFDYCDGHAYVMRVLVGEIAKEGKWVPLKSLAPRRGDLLDAVFERSFNGLSKEGRWVFLCVANWRWHVSELVLLAILALSDLDASKGIEECMGLALFNRLELADESFCYGAPELARLFAKKKLEGDADRLLIQEGMQELKRFGPLQKGNVASSTVEPLIKRFADQVQSLTDAAKTDAEERERIDNIMSNIANLWPKGFIYLARIRRAMYQPQEEVSYAYQRATEERPYDKDCWRQRAHYAQQIGDETVYITSMIYAVDADPSDIEQLSQTAHDLAKYVQERKSEIQKARRGVFLANVRAHFQRVADDEFLAEQLDPTDFSRLAWLFFLEGDRENAEKYAYMGLNRGKTNKHCKRIIEKLKATGKTAKTS